MLSKNRKWIFVLLLVPVFSIGGLVSNLAVSDDCSDGFRNAIDYVNLKTDRTVVSNAWPWIGYYANNEVSSVYDDLDAVMGAHNAYYFVHNTNFGGEYDVSGLNLENEFECVLVYKLK